MLDLRATPKIQPRFNFPGAASPALVSVIGRRAGNTGKVVLADLPFRTYDPTERDPFSTPPNQTSRSTQPADNAATDDLWWNVAAETSYDGSSHIYCPVPSVPSAPMRWHYCDACARRQPAPVRGPPSPQSQSNKPSSPSYPSPFLFSSFTSLAWPFYIPS